MKLLNYIVTRLWKNHYHFPDLPYGSWMLEFGFMHDRKPQFHSIWSQSTCPIETFPSLINLVCIVLCSYLFKITCSHLLIIISLSWSDVFVKSEWISSVDLYIFQKSCHICSNFDVKIHLLFPFSWFIVRASKKIQLSLFAATSAIQDQTQAATVFHSLVTGARSKNLTKYF